MKYFDIDWAGALEGLAAWTALPLPARRAALAEVQPGAGAAASSLGDELDALLAAGFVEWAPKGRRVAPPPHLRPLVVALRAMKRRGVWEAPTPAALVGYLDEHFTVQETQCLLRTRGFADGGHARRHLAEAASSEEWLEEFLAADTPDRALAWERARMTGYETQPRLADPEAGRATRELVRALLALPEPVPLAELVRHLPGASAETVGAALHAGLRYLLLFAALRADDLEPVVGPWPEAVRRLRGAEALPPPPDAVEVVEELECAWMLEDMTTVLVAAAGEPLRVRGSDMAIFARAHDAVEARLATLPEWAEEAAGTDGVARVETAVRLLKGLQHVRYAGAEGRDLRLEATPEGAAWLALPDRERLAALLGILRRSAERNPPGPYTANVLPFFPLSLSFDVAKGAGVDGRAALARALLALPDGFVPVAAFLEHVGRAANPYVEALRAGKKLRETYWGHRPPLRRDWEELWREMVAGFLAYRLVALGGARLGRTPGGEACFRLTEAGRYLLGAAETFEYGHAAEGEVAVQPNFEVVFLARAPRLEAMLARVAERVGPGPGVTFRLTRASVLAAAEAGMGRDQVLEALRSASSRALPANVERQVGDWLAAVRRVKLRPATLVECPDRETAARVQSAGGKQVRAVAPKVLELSAATGAARTALVRKLRAAGIFVE